MSIVNDGVGGHDLHSGLGDNLPGGHEVVRVLPHGEHVRGHCGFESLPDFLPHPSV